ncbi:MAG: hypothetical protein HFI34_12265 [Lachnospiraceae bacterium]|nr:hypothetical protein [Lachnospiraceae bacterium]
MSINIVCSDTYIDAFSKLDKKTQKKSLETIRLMRRSLRSDSLKTEKLNTKLDFKSARVTQDFRVIFTQSGNTVLLVYIDHHDAAYLWASKKLQGFDTANIKPAYEYFEQAKTEPEPLTDEIIDTSDNQKPDKPVKNSKLKPEPGGAYRISNHSVYKQPDYEIRSDNTSQKNQNTLYGLFSRFLLFLTGVATGIIIMYFI